MADMNDTTAGTGSSTSPGTTTTTGTPASTIGTSSTAAMPMDTDAGPANATDHVSGAHRDEAKSRFNAALQEVKAGAAALKAGAKGYGSDAKVKGRELADDGKAKASEGLRGLSRMVSENAYQVDEKLGAKYGDYARSASTALDDYAARLDEKSVDELLDDGREFVRKSPGLAIGIAAGAGFILSRIFRR